MTDISKRLSEKIKESNLSYSELEKLSSVPKSTIQRYAAGETKNIDIDKVSSIAKALGTSALYILGWEEHKKKADTLLDVSKDSDLQLVIERYSKLPRSAKKELVRYAEFLSTKEFENKKEE